MQNPGDLSLVAWPISGMSSLHQDYLNKLHEQSLFRGQNQPIERTNQVGAIMIPGVERKVRYFYFHHSGDP